MLLVLFEKKLLHFNSYLVCTIGIRRSMTQHRYEPKNALNSTTTPSYPPTLWQTDSPHQPRRRKMQSQHCPRHMSKGTTEWARPNGAARGGAIAELSKPPSDDNSELALWFQCMRKNGGGNYDYVCPLEYRRGSWGRWLGWWGWGSSRIYTLLATKETGDATPTAVASEEEFELVTVTYGTKFVINDLRGMARHSIYQFTDQRACYLIESTTVRTKMWGS